MTAYGITYQVNQGDEQHTTINAPSLARAKTKLGKKHGYKSGRKINIIKYCVIGYF